MTIWKFTLHELGSQSILIPKGARFLDVQVQRGEICFWAIVDPNRHTVPVNFFVAGTGHPLPTEFELGSRKYFGTVQINEFVWHVFTDGIIEGRN